MTTTVYECNVCLVLQYKAFFNGSVVQPEWGLGCAIYVSYVKGGHSSGVTNLTFNVQDTPGTASKLIINYSIIIKMCTHVPGKGAGFDYITVNTNDIRLFNSSPDRIENVVYTFHIRIMVEVTIIDINGKS